MFKFGDKLVLKEERRNEFVIGGYEKTGFRGGISGSMLDYVGERKDKAVTFVKYDSDGFMEIKEDLGDWGWDESWFELKDKKKTRGFEVVKDEKRKTVGEVTLPTRGTSKAMAYDFYANADITIEPNKIGKIWTDVKAYMGDNECLILNVRSSMGGKFMLANTQGWIDADYYSNEGNDGNIGVFLKNISEEPITIKKGERVAQGSFFTFLVADNGNTDNERVGGFGSTNK